jgi:hypothetical protein
LNYFLVKKNWIISLFSSREGLHDSWYYECA